mgnify:CR=1 FL=1
MVRVKKWTVGKKYMWESLMRLKGWVGDVVEVEGVVGRLVEVEGEWDWFGMEGWVKVSLREDVV